MTGVLSPQPFDLFLASVETASYDDYRHMPGAVVENAVAFDEMRAYLADRYSGMRAEASFAEDDGQIVDCIPAHLHPAASDWNEDSGGVERPAPPEPEAPESYGGDPPSAASPAVAIVAPRPGFRDFGAVPAGTAPVYRTTLEQLSRFKNLGAFAAKNSGSSTAGSAAADIRRYGTGEQDIANFGGASQINLWRPPGFISARVQGSFSQQWYLAGTEGTKLQTVECGWHIDLARYGDQDPHLFVFTTRNTYNEDPADNAYNEDASVFKRASANPYMLPGKKLQQSQMDGTQLLHKMGFYFHDRRWCFYVDDNLIGWYDAAWYQDGPLASGATRARFGGEVFNSLSSLSWPAMGSGKRASEGFGRAAFHRGAFIHYASGGAFQANLSEAGSVHGPCYSVDITNQSSDPDWGTYLFFGGPGGQGC